MENDSLLEVSINYLLFTYILLVADSSTDLSQKAYLYISIDMA